MWFGEYLIMLVNWCLANNSALVYYSSTRKIRNLCGNRNSSNNWYSFWSKFCTRFYLRNFQNPNDITGILTIFLKNEVLIAIHIPLKCEKPKRNIGNGNEDKRGRKDAGAWCEEAEEDENLIYLDTQHTPTWGENH